MKNTENPPPSRKQSVCSCLDTKMKDSRDITRQLIFLKYVEVEVHENGSNKSKLLS